MAAAAPPSAADCTAKTTPAAAQRAEAPATRRPALPQPHLSALVEQRCQRRPPGHQHRQEKPAPPMQPPPAAAQGCSCAKTRPPHSKNSAAATKFTSKSSSRYRTVFMPAPHCPGNHRGRKVFSPLQPTSPPPLKAVKSRKTLFFCPAKGICPPFFAKKYCPKRLYTL